MSTYIADLAPIVFSLVLVALFVWALERSNRRHPTAPWADEWRHHVDQDADHRRSEHDWDAYYHRTA
ncbi:hypothetical protein N802_08425 [Knoellia sinensis KCTC 19936]|uniref:Uncharacterized protein n=1 Tax=Knoellia sinensis KCTC 19936 TaxID=1385520 RepID=A0A0A0JB07_9MICO|nr:hypothetical protein [Knoellia sinensis]KGN33969.1 hypothetical protein N802_08425 [Knoellia sinensis KCTC 19936]